MASPRVLWLGQVEYLDSFAWMQSFTAQRNDQTKDEFWCLTHPAVFTQGTSCKDEPVANDGSIPLVKSDRGGQITYHGPGQLIIYLLIDIKRLGIGPKRLVRRIERAVISFLKVHGIDAEIKSGAPGVYVDQKKIAALGLRIKNGKSYHGLSLNIKMDLSPFTRIDPCGYAGLEVTQMSALGAEAPFSDYRDYLIDILIESIYLPIDAD